MIGKKYKFSNQFINRKTDDYQIWLTAVNWRTISTSDSEQNIEWSHWIKMSPTYSRWRRVEIEWIIIADSRENTSKAMDWLDNLFSLQAVITDTPELKEFIVVDEQNREWKLDCKIKEPIEYTIAEDDYMNWTTRSFRVVLQSADARFFSTEWTNISWVEWVIWWWKLWVKLWAPMNEKYNAITCYSSSNFWTPATITITTQMEINSPLKLRWETWHFYINSDFDPGDVIVIDSKTKTITKNWTNITELRAVWSTWPLIKWETTFVIEDKDAWLYASDFDVNVYFVNILM